jgi:pectate lyase
MKKMMLALTTICIGFAVNAQPPKVPAKAGTSFGSKTTADNAITVEQLYAKMSNKSTSVPVKLKGKVTEVCKEMGCWIKIQSEKGDMTVRMKDHSFFVPLELSGKTVVIDGIAEEKLTSVDELRDVAQDGGKSKAEVAKITQPKREIVVQAKGVLVL